MEIKPFRHSSDNLCILDEKTIPKQITLMKRSNPALLIIFSLVIWALVSSCSHENIKENSLNVLHSGILLPDPWPPKYAELPEAEEMRIPPYLKQKPPAIVINTGRQLFVDDFLIDETNMERLCHKPEVYSGNPILVPDRDWEYTSSGRPYAAPFSDGVWYDEKDSKFKMWYLAGAGRRTEEHGLYTCYAESDDGKNWKKPILDIIQGTNVADTFLRDAATVWLDKSEKDPDKRYKFFNVEQPWQFVLKYSRDGIHWNRGVAQSGNIGDRSTVFYNPFTKKWVASLRYNRRRTDGSFSRERQYLENTDPEMLVSLAHNIKADADDKNIVYWFGPDPREQRNPKFPDFNPGIYNLDAIAYESIILGFFTVHKGPENPVCRELGIPKRNEISMGFSRDGFHFYRPTHEVFIGVNESEGAWNYGNVQSVNGMPIIVDDSLYFYNSGRRLNNIYNDSHMSTGLATLRRDGFVSMVATNSEGFLITEEVLFNGKYFFVNADVNGKLWVEILDEKSQPVEGYKKDDCIALSGNSTRQLITWKNKKDLSGLSGEKVKIKFHLSDGELYSFWISPWESGESRGFTAGGGPGLDDSGTDIRK